MSYDKGKKSNINIILVNDHTGMLNMVYALKSVFPNKLYISVPVKYILVPVLKKSDGFVDNIFVQELNDKVYFLFRISLTISDPSVACSKMAEIV